MTRFGLTYLLVVCLALVLVAPVMAQRSSGGDGNELLQAVLDRTDQLLDKSDGVIKASGNAAALKALEQARNLQQWAKDQYAAGTADNKMIAEASLKARDLVRMALNFVAPGGDANNDLTDGSVQRKLDRAGEKLDRAADAVDLSSNPNLDALYQAARTNLDHAWEFYRNKQFRPALKLAEQVEIAADKLLMLAGESGSSGGEGFQRWYDNVANLIDQVGQMLQDCDSQTGKTLLDQARQNLELSATLNGKGKSGAFEALRTARELAMRASRECRGTSQLSQRYDRLASRLDQIKEQAAAVTGASKEALDKLIDQAGSQLDLARSLIDQNRPVRAQAALQAALLAIRQAESHLKQGK